MPEQTNTITIARPVGDVFAFLADTENDTQWRGGVIEMTRTGGQGVGGHVPTDRRRSWRTADQCRRRDH